ncbi:MAG: PadR family transcriptional regulator [Actinomycetes bacterium]
MARQSQTSTAVLGVLSIESATGYEIRRAIAEILGHFWHESFGQIYPCLAELESAGLIRSRPGERAGSSRFEITSAGRRRLRELLAEPATPQPPRNGTLLRTFFGHALPPADLGRLLDEVESQARGHLSAYGAIRDGIAAEDGYDEHGPYWEATIRAGELAAGAQLTWVVETRAALLGSPVS